MQAVEGTSDQAGLWTTHLDERTMGSRTVTVAVTVTVTPHGYG